MRIKTIILCENKIYDVSKTLSTPARHLIARLTTNTSYEFKLRIS